jgi:hypothetical protein
VAALILSTIRGGGEGKDNGARQLGMDGDCRAFSREPSQLSLCTVTAPIKRSGRNFNHALNHFEFMVVGADL